MHPDIRRILASHFFRRDRTGVGYIQQWRVRNMNGNRYYGVRVEGAKYGVGFGSALAIAISYTANHSILWAIIHGILGWLYVIYFALFRS
jgi:hypothetical protein